jgi:hypothetical protein
MTGRGFLSLVAGLVLAACATGGEPAPGRADGLSGTGEGPVLDAGTDGYVWPDLGPPPDAFIWPDVPADVSMYDDAGPPLDAATPDAQPDAGSPCPDPFEPNEVCAAGKSIGTAKEGSTWISKTATSSPAGDVDWFTAVGEEASNWCVPGTGECFYLKARLQVPTGRLLKICVMQDSCGAIPTCADNAGAPGPVQLDVQYKVDGTCALNDDTQARIWVEQLDTTGTCDSYTISVNFNEC